jgi:spermidine synthase
MTQPNADSPTRAPALRPFLPALVVLFVGSGCAALIYEVVWLQLLQLVIGSSAVSLAVLLGTFMGGMCLGSLLFPRLVSARRHPLRVYAFLELGTGALALGVLLGMPYVEQVYALYGGHGLAGVLFRGAVASVCLLPPSLLMGATLPAVARWVEASRQGVSWLGFFYGGNIAGAVVGCLLAGFYLLRVYDMPAATYVACAIDVTVALIALALARVAGGGWRVAGEDSSFPATRHPPPATTWAVYIAIGLSGMSALGAEVVWTRLLSLMLGGTVYTFSLILAVFLTGLGIGSSIGVFLARGKAPRVALGVCQMLLAAGVAWTAFMVSDSLPYWPISPALSASPWYTFQLDLVRCLWAVLPPACLWGASFPLALAAVAAPGQDSGRLVGGVYAANTVGAIAGALGFSLVVIPHVGTVGAERVLIGLSVVAGLIVLVTHLALGLTGLLADLRNETGDSAARLLRWVVGAAFLPVATLIAVGIAWSLRPVPWGVVAYGRHAAAWGGRLAPGVVSEADVPRNAVYPDIYCTYVGEGMNVSVAVTSMPDQDDPKTRYRQFHGAGKVQASSNPVDMRLQRMLGHIPALVHKKPETVLVVACGAGVTAGSFIVHPDVKRIVICDIEPLVPTTVTPMFGKENYHVVDGIAQQNPITVNGKEVEVVYDDGRHFLRTTKEKFDVITSDPIDPWVKGCAALNTVEYYQMCKEHLNPGGSVSLWIPLYESNLDTSKSVIATFFQVFPDGIIWSNEDSRGKGYDAVLFGTAEPTVIDVDQLQERLDRPDHKAVKESLREVGFGKVRLGSGGAVAWEPAIDLLSTYAGQGSHLREWSRGAQINTDRNLRLQYLAGMWLNSYMGEQILNGILAHYRFPQETFVGSPERLKALREALAGVGRKEHGGVAQGGDGP